MKFVEHIVTVGGLGKIPYAPGTFGSVPGLLLGLLVHYFLRDYLKLDAVHFYILSTGLGLVFCILAQKATVRIEKTWRHDDKRIVIDELAGQYFSTVYFPVTWFYALASFALFRFFDILKPWPISWVDQKWHDPLATLVDDLLAAVLAIACLSWISSF